MKSAACLRYGIKAKPCMESSWSDVCNQSEGEIHADAWCHTPSAITYSPAVRLHANPSDWIEKRPFSNGLFSWLPPAGKLDKNDWVSFLAKFSPQSKEYEKLSLDNASDDYATGVARSGTSGRWRDAQFVMASWARTPFQGLGLRPSQQSLSWAGFRHNKGSQKKNHTKLVRVVLFWLPLLGSNQRQPD